MKPRGLGRYWFSFQYSCASANSATGCCFLHVDVTLPEAVRGRDEKWDGALFCRALTTEGCEGITGDQGNLSICLGAKLNGDLLFGSSWRSRDSGIEPLMIFLSTLSEDFSLNRNVWCTSDAAVHHCSFMLLFVCFTFKGLWGWKNTASV